MRGELHPLTAAAPVAAARSPQARGVPAAAGLRVLGLPRPARVLPALRVGPTRHSRSTPVFLIRSDHHRSLERMAIAWRQVHASIALRRSRPSATRVTRTNSLVPTARRQTGGAAESTPVSRNGYVVTRTAWLRPTTAPMDHHLDLPVRILTLADSTRHARSTR